jgi:hydrogenase nickel incorporation protein HypA/HybF
MYTSEKLHPEATIRKRLGFKKSLFLRVGINFVHELSVAMSLLDEIGEVAEREGATSVATVRLKVGRLSGIARDALLFAWDLARADTVASNAELHIEDIEVIVFCPRCEQERAPVQGSLICSVCGAAAPSIVRGRELELVALEVVS